MAFLCLALPAPLKAQLDSLEAPPMVFPRTPPEPVELLEAEWDLDGRTWTTDDLLPARDAHRIFQDSRGYLWFGFATGLARFDGVHFKVFNRNTEDSLVGDEVTDIIEAADGTLLVATYGGLWSIHDGQWTVWDKNHGLEDRIPSVAAGQDGAIWIGAYWKLHYLDPGGRHAEFEKAPMSPAYQDKLGRIWIHGRGAFAFRSSDGKLYPIGSPKVSFRRVIEKNAGELYFLWNDISRLEGSSLSLVVSKKEVESPINDFCVARSGALLLATAKGLYQWNNGSLRRLRIRGGMADNYIWSVAIDREENIWVGTEAGVKRLRTPALKTICPQNALQQQTWAVQQSKDGGFWCATTGGLLHINTNSQILAFTTNQGLPSNWVRMAQEDAHGVLWFSFEKSELWGWSGGWARAFRIPAGEPEGITTLALDAQGNVMVAGHGAAGVFNGFKYTAWNTNLTFRSQDYCGALETRSGSIWLGTYGGQGLLCRTNGSNWVAYSEKDGVPSRTIGPLYADASDAVWFGTDRGIVRWKNGRFSWIRVEDGLLEGIIFNLIEDNYGYLWSNGRNGIYRYPKLLLDQFCDGKAAKVEGFSFGVADGLLTGQGEGPSVPGACKTARGQILIPTVKGVVVIDPSKLQLPARPVNVCVEQLAANGRVVRGDDLAMRFGPVKLSAATSRKTKQAEIRFAPGTAASLRIQYTAVAFASPNQVLFERKLDGLDTGWKKAGANGKERFAYFTNLKPGHYAFRVRARYPNGEWTEAGAPLSFYIAPRFYETAWFYLASGGGLLLAGFGFHRQRLSTERKLRLLEQKNLLEQDRARIARDMHDSLGANLAKIKLMSETGLQIAENPSAREKFGRIAENARTAARDMDEIIWVLKAREHTARELVAFLSNYSEDFLSDCGIRFWEETSPDLPELSLAMDACHHLFLAVKEALTNMAKHSGARQAWLRAFVRDRAVILELQDDGAGVAEKDLARPGHGLANMKARIAAVGAQFHWTSEPGKGTKLQIAIAY